MTRSDAKVAARRAVLEAQSELRRARREREDRIAALAIEVSVALATGRAAMEAGQAALAQAEVTAGHAVERMLAMGLSVPDVADWCAGDITPRVVARLRKAAADPPTDHASAEPHVDERAASAVATLASQDGASSLA